MKNNGMWAFLIILAGLFGVSSVLMSADAPAGEPAATQSQPADANCGNPEYLQAGPIRMKFQDGQLRYLYVGDREIVRRIYFAVRDARWDTVPPVFANFKLQRGSDGFKISFDAICKASNADFFWSGVITGKADGKLEFAVSGKAMADFNSPRIGLCVLFGAESLAGEDFSVKTAGDVDQKSKFPKQISAQHPAERFKSLECDTGGTRFSLNLEGGLFSIEDQRVFADSSFKAYSSMDYTYPKIVSGARAEQKLTISVSAAARPTEPASRPTAISFGTPIDGAKVPTIVQIDKPVKGQSFSAILNFKGDGDSIKDVSWLINPAWHLTDDDMFMENLSAALDQARAARSILPNAALKVGPAGIDSPYPRTSPDPRNATQFAAAWSAGLMKYLTLGGIEEATFRVGPGPANKVLDAFASYAGWQAILVKAAGRSPRAVEACAAINVKKTVCWLVNITGMPQKATLEGLPDEPFIQSRPGKADDKPQSITCKNHQLEITLEPFDVVFLLWEK